MYPRWEGCILTKVRREQTLPFRRSRPTKNGIAIIELQIIELQITELQLSFQSKH